MVGAVVMVVVMVGTTVMVGVAGIVAVGVMVEVEEKARTEERVDRGHADARELGGISAAAQREHGLMGVDRGRRRDSRAARTR